MRMTIKVSNEKAPLITKDEVDSQLLKGVYWFIAAALLALWFFGYPALIRPIWTQIVEAVPPVWIFILYVSIVNNFGVSIVGNMIFWPMYFAGLPFFEQYRSELLTRVTACQSQCAPPQ